MNIGGIQSTQDLKTKVVGKVNQFCYEPENQITAAISGGTGLAYTCFKIGSKLKEDKAIFANKDNLFKDAPADKGKFFKMLRKNGLSSSVLSTALKSFVGAALITTAIVEVSKKLYNTPFPVNPVVKQEK